MDQNMGMWDIIINEQRYTPAPGALVMDMGAWVGFFTVYCASRGASVVAYEPVPLFFSELKKRVENEPCSSRVSLINRAVWKQTGTSLIHQCDDNGGSSSMCPGTRALYGPLLEIETDSLEKALAGRVYDCVKCDIEGAEYDVFAHAEPRLLKNIRYLTMELHNDILSKQQHDMLVDHLKSNFSYVTAVPEVINGVQTGRMCKLFCKGAL